jgi:DNA adenine methylase
MISRGRTGMITPKPIVSITTVNSTKISEFFLRAGIGQVQTETLIACTPRLHCVRAILFAAFFTPIVAWTSVAAVLTSHARRQSGPARGVPKTSVTEPSPIVKWVGGKSRVLAQLVPLLPEGAALMRHVEPFVGGGALFFSQRPARALLADVNPQLIATYEAVRDSVEAVIEQLARLSAAHGPERYYHVRDRYNHGTRLSAPERAAIFIYLNKTCFNGLHRVNRRGEFNVPAGRYANPRILDAELLRAASRELARAQLRCDSFESLIAYAKPGDFIYFDPPYAPASPTANFTAYAQDGFGHEEQVRLRDVFRELDRRRCKLMLSNSDVPAMRELYAKFNIDVVAAPRAVNCDATKRGLVSEIVVRNYG